MSIVEKNVSVNMIRRDLDNLPSFSFREGFCSRWFEPEDVDLWVKLYTAADEYNKITPELFFDEFGEDTDIWHQRICFIEDDKGVALGTAAAWFNNDFQGESWGRIHWVAIIPEAQGKGLSKPMMSAVCERLKHLGHEKAYLVTSSARVPAINLYRKFGFMPDVSTSEKQQIWDEFEIETGIGFE